MLNAEEAHRSKMTFSRLFKILCRLFPALFDNFDNILRQLSAIFVFVLFAMQYKVRLSSTKRYHLF
jgi:hypothetical protein